MGMANEKKSSKGRFLYLFEWNANSRKKLFINNKPEVPDGLNQGKEFASNLVASQFSMSEVHANGDSSIAKGSLTCGSASSACSDDGYGSKAPGVVAKLMGLESLPASRLCEQSSLSFNESCIPGDSDYSRSESGIHRGHCSLDYNSMPRGVDGFLWNSMDSRLNKAHCQPIERFQTEGLPPKTAKPISITHHKLLSPIKSPGFVPTNDAAYIMEAAARIIDSTGCPTSTTRNSLFESSSAPMRIRDPKDKSKALDTRSWMSQLSRKPQQSAFNKQMRGNMQERSKKTPISKPSIVLETCSLGNSIDKGKGISLGVHDTSSVQNLRRKEGSTSSSSRSSVQKEHKHAKLKQSRCQQSSQRSGLIRSSSNRSSGVLKQNNVKQNSITPRDRSTSRASISGQDYGKTVLDSSSGTSKLINKVIVNSENGARKYSPATSAAQQRRSLVRMNNISRNKDLVSKNNLFDETMAEGVFTSNDKSYSQSDFSLHTTSEVGRNLNVISFTFTSPIKGSGSTSDSRLEFADDGGDFGIGSYDLNTQHESKASLPHLRLNFITGDSLSLLLEQKLKELTDRVESIQPDSISEDTDVDSSSSLPDSISGVSSMTKTSVEKNRQSPKADPTKKCYEVTEEHSSSSSGKGGAKEVFDDAYYNAFVTDYSNSLGSCLSSSSNADCSYGNEQPSPLGSQQVSGNCSSDNLHLIEHERDYSDTASSACIEEWGGNLATTADSSTDFRNSCCWELEYVKQLVRFAVLEGSLSGENIEIIASGVFDQLEHLIIPTLRNVEENLKVDRKHLFDCVNECVRLRSGGMIFGSHKAWAKWRAFVQNGDALAAELCGDISRLKSMGSLMLDDLVDKDMSTQPGSWHDFHIETLEEGMRIEEEIEASLIDELILDISLS
ncbi:hypothetical protein Dimus_012106 [Dionaea muscipula]